MHSYRLGISDFTSTEICTLIIKLDALLNLLQYLKAKNALEESKFIFHDFVLKIKNTVYGPMFHFQLVPGPSDNSTRLFVSVFLC